MNIFNRVRQILVSVDDKNIGKKSKIKFQKGNIRIFHWSWLISRPFVPFQVSLDGIRQHDLLLKMRFPVLKL